MPNHKEKGRKREENKSTNMFAPIICIILTF